MKTIENPFNSFFKFYFLSALLGMVSMWSCKNDIANELQDQASIEKQTEDPLLTKKMILEYNFRIATAELSEDEINGLYEEKIKVLTEEDLIEMTAMYEQVISQNEVYDVTGQGITNRTAETLLTNGTADDAFGQAVEYVSNKAYVGASNEQKVYWYSKSGGGYNLLGEIVPDGASDDFGYHVSVSGNWMAVGAPDFGQPFGRPGQVFVFKRQSNTWIQTAVLSGPANEVNFGGDGVEIRGSKIFVTSRGTGFPSPGSTISVFQRSGNSWVLSGTIFEPNRDWFAMDVNESGTQVVATGSENNSAGIVRATIFKKVGNSWDLDEDVIIPSPTPFANAIPRDVSISLNNIVLTSLVPGNKAWVISKTGGTWALNQEVLLPGVGAPFTNRFASIDRFKFAVATASNNNAIPDQVHIFKRYGSNWNLEETITPSETNDVMIWGVRHYRNTTLIGLPGAGFVPPLPAGKAFVFE